MGVPGAVDEDGEGGYGYQNPGPVVAASGTKFLWSLLRLTS